MVLKQCLVYIFYFCTKQNLITSCLCFEICRIKGAYLLYFYSFTSRICYIYRTVFCLDSDRCTHPASSPIGANLCVDPNGNLFLCSLTITTTRAKLSPPNVPQKFACGYLGGPSHKNEFRVWQDFHMHTHTPSFPFP